MPVVVADPLAVITATAADKLTYRLQIEQLPIETTDTHVFAADILSLDRMEKAVENWAALSITDIDWLLLDNSTVECDATELSDYLDEIKELKAIRYVAVQAEYITYLGSSPSIRDLENWKASYVV